MKRMHASILAVGTEITDGQITNRNAAWISQRLVELGLTIEEHRSVPDEWTLIASALAELLKRNEILFVTGGLGPTSDDFTREVIAQVIGRPLEFNGVVWEQINQKLQSRGVTVRESQRSQAQFPSGAKVLANPAGTADGFYIEVNAKHIFVLPGPPAEVAAIWAKDLAPLLSSKLPVLPKETLHLLRCMGKGESEFAHVTEDVFSGSDFRLGYRAHPPYVEIKVWVPAGRETEAATRLKKLEDTIGEFIVNRDDEDLAKDCVHWLNTNNASLTIYDSSTQGLFNERLGPFLREATAKLEVHSIFEPNQDAQSWLKAALLSTAHYGLAVAASGEQSFLLGFKTPSGESRTQAISIPFRYNASSERGRRYIVEKALLQFRDDVISPKLR